MELGCERKVIFLDRDGTVNKEVNYLHRIDEFSFIEGVPQAIRIFNRLGYLVVVVTNQAGIAKGYYSISQMQELNAYMQHQLGLYGAYIDAIYYCPHHAEGKVSEYAMACGCRKPEPGMILQAVYDFRSKGIEISLLKSVMVGDKQIDIECGANAGIGRSILVRSGHSTLGINIPEEDVYDHLLAFAMDLEIKAK